DSVFVGTPCTSIRWCHGFVESKSLRSSALDPCSAMVGGPFRPLWRRAGADSSYTRAVSVYADLIRYRELFANLFRRDLQARYRGSVLGVAWSLALPLLLRGAYVRVFSVLLRV